MTTIPAGWYPDGAGNHRWWDGRSWTGLAWDEQSRSAATEPAGVPPSGHDVASTPVLRPGRRRGRWRRTAVILLTAAVIGGTLVVFAAQFGEQIAGLAEVRCPWDAPLMIGGVDISGPQCVSVGGWTFPRWVVIAALGLVSLLGGFAVDRIREVAERAHAGGEAEEA